MRILNICILSLFVFVVHAAVIDYNVKVARGDDDDDDGGDVAPAARAVIY